MTNDLTTDKLSDLFQALNQKNFTGKVQVQAAAINWTLYFCLGRLVWAAGGSHPIRRWSRIWNQHCPQVRLKNIRVDELNESLSWKYQVLISLVKQQTIANEQAVAVIKNTIADVLFDMLQQEEKAALIFSCNLSDEQTVLDTSLLPINPEQALQEAGENWRAWCDAGLASISPNLAPVLKKPEELEKIASPRVYQTLVKLIDGKRTLRTIAVAVKQDVLTLTRSLIPYIRKQIIGLANVPDFPKPVVSVAEKPASDRRTTVPPVPANTTTTTEPVENSLTPTPNPKSKIQNPKSIRPLIAHVEDSEQERQIMSEILTEAQFGLVSISDSTQALPILLEHKPDLIFLDLVMPVANGYEICAQIRRVSMFKDTPVIILTGNDGIVDRVRAKMVGATDFLPKPIDEFKVMVVLQKYLNTLSASSNSKIPNLKWQTSN